MAKVMDLETSQYVATAEALLDVLRQQVTAAEQDAAECRAEADALRARYAAYHERIRSAMGGYADSDLASLADTLRRRCNALEAEDKRLMTALVESQQSEAYARAEMARLQRLVTQSSHK